MKKLALILLIVTASYAEVVTIIDNGVERKINLATINSNVHARMVVGTRKEAPGIIVAFKKDSKVNVAQFAKKYNLKLKKKLIIGYYIFANKSSLPDVKLIYKIFQESKDIIKTVRPNWGLNNKPR